MSKRFIAFEVLPQGIDQTGIDCANPINDEYSAIENPELLEAIELAKENGLDARVVIQRSIGEEGYTSSDTGIFDFTADFSQYCQVGGDGIVFAVSDDNPRAFDVLTSGRADAPYVSGREAEELIDAVREDLRNDGSSYQADAADAIEMVVEHVQEHENVSVASEQPVQDVRPVTPEPIVEQPPKESGDSIGNVLYPVWGAGTGLAIIGIGGFLAKRRIDYGRALKAVKLNRERPSLQRSVLDLAIDETLAPLHENDAQTLRKMQKELEQMDEYLGGVYDEFTNNAKTYKTFKSGSEHVHSLAEPLNKVIEDMLIYLESVAAERLRVYGLAAELPEVMSNVETSKSTVKQLLKGLQDKGYDTSFYDETIAEAERDLKRAETLKKDGYVVETADLATKSNTTFDSLRTALDEVEEFRDLLLVKEDEVLELSTNATTDVESARSGSVKFASHYNDDYDMNATVLLDNASAIEREIRSLAANVVATHDTKDIAKLHVRDAEMQKIETLSSELAGVLGSLQSLQQEWISAKDFYQSGMETLRSKISAFTTYVSEHSGDVEGATAQGVHPITSNVDTIKTQHDGATKPHYLNLQADIVKQQGLIEQLARKAVAEKEEMDSLRATVSSYPATLRSSLSDAQSFARMHSGDVSSATRVALGNILISESDARTRSDLKSAVSAYENIASSIKSLHEDAVSDYNDAEDARERARQAAVAAAEKARRAAQQSFKIGGGHRGGNHGSGTGHKGGGF